MTNSFDIKKSAFTILAIGEDDSYYYLTLREAPGVKMQQRKQGTAELPLGLAERTILALVQIYLEAIQWTDEDEAIPEDKAIKASSPMHPETSSTQYAEALRMVDAKRSKYALVDLVNWLLMRIHALESMPIGSLAVLAETHLGKRDIVSDDGEKSGPEIYVRTADDPEGSPVPKNEDEYLGAWLHIYRFLISMNIRL